MRTLLLWLCLASAAAAQPSGTLPRRGYFGAAFAPGPNGEIVFAEVFSGGAAGAAGLRQGDVVLTVDGREIKQPSDAPAALRGKRAGAVVPVEIRRGAERITAKVTLGPLPFEKGEGIDVVYGAVRVDGALRRTVLTKPISVGGRVPAMLLVGGVGCYAVDSPLQPTPYREIAHRLAREGFAVMRVEKSGIGDSEGTPCYEVDLDNELAGYREALRSLRSLPFVDPEKVFLFGHSMGGIEAPLLAKDVPVRGMMVMATVGDSWFEYELSNTRRQSTLRGESEPAVDSAVAGRARCVRALLIDKVANPPAECDADRYPASLAYMRQVAAVPLAAAWQATSAPVLVMYGKSDFVSGEADHQYLAARINRMTPGRATLLLIDGLDHFFMRRASQRASMNGDGQPAEMNLDWLPKMVEWMRSRAS